MARRLITERGITERPSRDPHVRKFEISVSAGKHPDGRRRVFRKVVNGTLQQARVVRTEFEIRAGRAETLQDRVTLGEVLALWQQRSDHSDKTTEDYNSVIRTHLPEELKERKIGSISKLDIDALMVSLRSNGVSADRQIRVRNVLSGAFTYAVTMDIVPTNPVKAIQRPKQPITKPKAPELAVLRDFLDFCAETPDWCEVMVILDAVTGLRRGELCALRWQDINFIHGEDRAEITVHSSVTQVAGKQPELKETKTGNMRIISITGQTLQVLRQWKETSNCIQDPECFVFSPDYDALRPFRPERITRHYRRMVSRYIEKTGRTEIGEYQMRNLRNFMVTQVVNKHGPLAAANRAGHSNPRTTMSVYAAHMPSQDAQVANDIDDALFSEDATAMSAGGN